MAVDSEEIEANEDEDDENDDCDDDSDCIHSWLNEIFIN